MLQQLGCMHPYISCLYRPRRSTDFDQKYNLTLLWVLQRGKTLTSRATAAAVWCAGDDANWCPKLQRRESFGAGRRNMALPVPMAINVVIVLGRYIHIQIIHTRYEYIYVYTSKYAININVIILLVIRQCLVLF